MPLPDCANRPRDLELGPAQRAALFRVLAEQGPQGVEAWLREEAKRDPRVRERVEATRAGLEREARARRREREAGVAADREQSRTAWERAMRDAAQRERDLMARLRPHAGDLDPTEALLAARPPRKPGVLRRIVAWLYSVWVALVGAWVRLVRRLRGQPVPTRGKGARMDAARLLRERPDLLAALRLESGPGLRDRMRRAWERLAGREDYDEALRRLAEREAEAAKAKAQLAVESENARIEEELEALRREEKDAAERRRRDEERLEEEQSRIAREEEDALARGPLQAVGREILDDLRSVGLVDAQGRATSMLLERFGASLQEEALASLPGGGQATPGHYAGGEGEYERGPLRSLHELGAVELEGSLVQARTRHPQVRHLFDEDVLVHRELRLSAAHVVIVLDTSGSMEEQGRLEAARRVALVLHRMMRQMGPEHRVDLLTMGTGVARASLADVWSATPGGFTNFSAAFREARQLFDAEGADRRVLYVVTDGLPEAMTLPDGRDVADSPRVCLPDAVKEAKRLGGDGGVRLVIYQLEGKDPLFVDAAQRMAKAAHGRVEVLDPAELMRSLLVELQDAVRQADMATV